MSWYPVYRCRRDDEEGAFLVVWVLLLIGLLTMVAIVIDLAQLRQDRRQQRLSADAGATAGGLTLTRTAAGRLAACEDAWTYAAENLGFGPTPPPSPCGSAVTGDCNNTSPATQSAVASLGSYKVTITTPVLAGDALMAADAAGGDVSQPANSNTGINDSDGKPCERIGVRITNVRASTFGAVVGFDNNTTDVHSVARSATDDGELFPNLVVLEPHDCAAMKASGKPAIEVVGSATLRGGIVIVSDGNGACSGADKLVLDVGSGAGDESHVTAAVNGDIYMKAGNGVCTGTACDPGQLDVSTCWNPDPDVTTCKGYYPAPLPLPVTINRSRVDYLYNCRSDYTTPGNYRHVTIDGTTMAACTGTGDEYMNALYKEVVDNNGLHPASPTVYGTGVGSSCGPLPSPFPPGNVDFNCDLPNSTILVVNGNARFRQASLSPVLLTVNGNAVFDGTVNIGTGNQLEVGGNSYFGGDLKVTGGVVRLHGKPGFYDPTCKPSTFVTNVSSCVTKSAYTAGPPSSGAAFAFIMGNLEHNGGDIYLDRVMVYGGATGRLNRQGNGNLTWSAPSSGSPFAKLSYWSDSTLIHEMGGGGKLFVEGVFFSPDATFLLGGGSPTTPRDAQFWAKRLHAAGTSVFRMTPDPDLISTPTGPVVRLIR